MITAALVSRSNVGLFALLAFVTTGCGGSSPPPEPEPEATAGEEEPPPPPPPPPARVRFVHAAYDPAAASISAAFDGAEALVSDLAYQRASAYLELAAGEHMVSLVGADGAELVGWTMPAVAEDSSTTVIISSSEDLPVILSGTSDVSTPPSDTVASVRVFHAVVGMDAVDVCIAGESARADGIQIFSAVAPATFAGSAETPYADVPASGAEMVLQLRAAHATACHGRVQGVARVTLIPGNRYTLIATGRTGGRVRVDREVLICADPPATDTSCATVAITAR